MPAKKVYLIDVLGMGGWHLDPPRGQLQIVRRLHDEGVECVPPFDPGDGSVIGVVKSLRGEMLMYVGDSCGANRFSWVQASAPEVSWRYAALIQASLYCNGGCPPIGGTVADVDIFYTSFLTWPLPGLGCYKPKPAVPPPGGINYAVANVCNNSKTTIHYWDQRIHVHPGDDDEGTQAIILKKAQQLLAEAAKAK
jgi:hypothetical protein